MTEPILVDQVLLLRDAGASEELGAALWAALREVEAFYNLDRKRATFRRTYISEVVPRDLKKGPGRFMGLERLVNLFGSAMGWQENWVERSAEQFLQQSSAELWESSEGKFSRTYDARKIAGSVRQLPEMEQARAQVIVTDQELTPPRDWRYVIWDRGVISTVPTDPEYWQMQDPHRIAVIKHRVRTACISVVGTHIGLRRCDNERCFLYDRVESVLRLDRMVELGPEHGIEALAGRGFEVRSSAPKSMQPVLKNPAPDEGWWYYA